MGEFFEDIGGRENTVSGLIEDGASVVAKGFSGGDKTQLLILHAIELS
ncbi:MAG: hypothetical protein J7L34_03385 [Thermotogaceae bacterium]|nr:hypothetical protein [Thermotogaceae bacterium]